MAIWKTLAENLIVCAFMISAWAHLHPKLENRFGLQRSTLFGIWMGLTVVVSMVFGVEIKPGVLIDFRTAVISMAALFGGPVAAFMTWVIGASYRVMLGGAGVYFGVANMAVAGLLSAGLHVALKEQKISFIHITLMSALLTLVSLVLALNPWSPFDTNSLYTFGLPINGMNFLSALVAGFAIMKVREYAMERDLLRAALAQSPDYYYVKDRASRFKIVNMAVALHNGFKKPREMMGLTDTDITDPVRADRLFEEEQNVMEQQAPLQGKEERINYPTGARWYSSSKVPLYSDNGEVIGMAGVTHDITDFKTLEEELTTSRNLLARAMREMSDGLVMFNKDGILVFCNDQYRAFFPLTSEARVPGAHIRDILKAVVATSEQVNIPEAGEEDWIQTTASNLFVDHDQEVRTQYGRWLNIRTRVAQDGSSLVVVADMTAMKESELALMQLTDKLRKLAETDGLTELLNRRSFDNALESEMKKATVTATPLSVLLIDVDRFKAYNDQYGHTAGDECLQIIAQCLSQTKVRARDVVARYGGEEFAMLLPDTDVAGAVAVAARFQTLLKERARPHVASEAGIVSASIGVATFSGLERIERKSVLINRADEALYTAKASGRDCVRSWEILNPEKKLAVGE